MSTTILGITVYVSWILYVGFAVMTDTVFGLGRAIKEKGWNSSFGINGAIRKVAMVTSIIFLAAVDIIMHVNLIGFIPDEILTYFPKSIATIGVAEFFGLLYIAYEIVSILKNMTLCGLPTKAVWQFAYNLLNKYTDELPDTDEIEMMEAEEKEEKNV